MREYAPIVSPGVSADRKTARDLLALDPMMPSRIETDGSVQVGDSEWDADVFDYANNGFKGAVVAVEGVFDAEQMKPAIIVGGGLLQKHRQDAKDVAAR